MSGDKTYKSGREAREKLGKDVTAGVRKALAGAQVRVHNRMLALAQGLTPKASGEMLRQWKSLPGNPQTVADALRPSKVVNAARHAGVIDQGRKRNKKGYSVQRKKGARFRVGAGARVVGSAAAPLGVSVPVLRTVEAEVPAILEQEIAKAGGGE